ncbi:MAG: hypothetical protein WEA77_14890 [Hyphomonas sp.]|uniref:hypothetical protein n=1 Tax=Hyphomonas sp. TaxID=87 RepID=UPI0034A07155
MAQRCGFALSRLDPSARLRPLRRMRVPKYILARAERARTPAVLFDPRRRGPAPRPAKGCALKGAR